MYSYGLKGENPCLVQWNISQQGPIYGGKKYSYKF